MGTVVVEPQRPGKQLQCAWRKPQLGPPKWASAWSITTRAWPSGGRGRFTHGEAAQEEGQRAIKEGAQDAVWKSCWHWLAAQSATWYATPPPPPGEVGCQFTTVTSAELQGVINQKWNSKQPLVFSHVVLSKTLGYSKDREIRDRIT